MGPTLRRAVDSDVAAIAALTDRAYEKYVPRMGRKPQPMLTDYHEFIAHHIIWLLEVQQGIIGVLAIEFEPETLLIYSVAIDPAQQRRGWGRLLLAHAEAEAKTAGYASIRLYTNALMEENIALYTKLGYQETVREPFGNAVRVHMTKHL